MPRSTALTPPLGMGDHGFQRGAAHAVAPHDGMNKRGREHLAKWWLEARLAPRLAVVWRVKQFGELSGYGISLPEQPGPSAPAALERGELGGEPPMSPLTTQEKRARLSVMRAIETIVRPRDAARTANHTPPTGDRCGRPSPHRYSPVRKALGGGRGLSPLADVFERQVQAPLSSCRVPL